MSSTSVLSDGGIKALFNLESDLEYMIRVAGPQALVMTLNRLRKKIRTDVTNKVWADAKYLPLRDSKGRKVRGKKIRTGIKRGTIFNRVHTSRATRTHVDTRITGYIKDIPLTSLGTIGKKTKTSTLTFKSHSRKTTGKRAKVQQSSLGGLSLGGQFLYQSFIQAVSEGASGTNVQAFRRDQKATWAAGQHGWSQRKGDPSMGRGKVPPRAPYSVLKAELGASFDKHFKSTVGKTVEENFGKEYDKSLQVVMARLLRNT
jgi:hypothetical protein